MLRLSPRQIPCAAYPPVGRRRPASAEAEQGLEGSRWLLPAVVPKHELVQVHLQLRPAHAMMGAHQPLLQVPDRSVGQRHDRFRTLPQINSVRLCPRDMLVPCFLQPSKGLETVSVDRRARRDVLLDETAQRRRLKVRDYGHADPPRGLATLLDGDQHQSGSAASELAAPAKPSLGTANPRVVDLHRAVERLAGSIDRRSSEFVQHHPGRLVASEPPLALQQKGRNPALIGRHQVRRPEPQRQRDLRVVENGPGR